MSSSVDYSDFDVELVQALTHPEVVEYLADVSEFFKFDWQLKILPASRRPADSKHIEKSFMDFTYRMFLPKARIYITKDNLGPTYSVVLHELAHVDQIIAGYIPGSFSTPFTEHDADARVQARSTYPIIDIKSKIMLNGIRGRYDDAGASLKIRCFLYAAVADREKLLPFLENDKDPVIQNFIHSSWVTHDRYQIWRPSVLNEAAINYRKWAK